MNKKIMNSNTKRESWIDMLKLLASFGVMVGHTDWFLDISPYITWASYFCVTTFVFLGGACEFASWKRRKQENKWKSLLQKEQRILVPYAVATAIYLLRVSRPLDLKTYLDAVLNFTACPPFYFVVFYIQLTAIAYPLYVLVGRCLEGNNPLLLHGIAAAGILLVSVLAMRYTYILPVHGGGQFLFGGTYLFIYYLGMLFQAYRERVKWTPVKAAAVFGVTLPAAAALVWFMKNNGLVLDEKLVYFGNINPPGISFLIYSLLVVLLVWSLERILYFSGRDVLIKAWDKVSRLGSFSLYMFLYHYLVILILRRSALDAALDEHMGIKRIVYFTAMTVCPVLIGMTGKIIVQTGKKFLKEGQV